MDEEQLLEYMLEGQRKNCLEILTRVSSDERLDVLLAVTRRKPAEVFWPVFFDAWSSCDDTWWLREYLLSELRRRNADSPGVLYLSDDTRAFLDSLPDPVPVFRGCSRERVRSICWTTNREVAKGFAAGHRFIPVAKPVIATALIPKSAVFGVCLDRNEFDVLLDPKRLRQLHVTEVSPAAMMTGPNP